MITHDFPFDPTYGYTLDDLLAVTAPAEPADFQSFWQDKYAKARQIPLNIDRREIESPDAAFQLYRVSYDSWDGVRIGAWITVPKSEPIESATVVGHGYGGRDAPGFEEPIKNTVCIYPCVRGFQLSPHQTYPGDGHKHVMVGIESEDSYSHLGSVVDYWLAASVLESLYPQTSDKLYYLGGSFGGGIGALMLPWDSRFKKAFLDIPSFGNHPLRVELPCVGSGESVQKHFKEGHPEVLEVLSYFDAAIAAKHIQIPVFVAAATFDPAVPPPGQFAVYNSLSGPKELFIRQAAHFELSGNEHDNAATHARLLRWFAQ
ncbi:acetylxylan esterase [Coraliomargarita sp. SDUM461004]|uniref:Acetylxylan esterase n=1 Tax=Thalassobacterium sedimentorum TaxID=3041258 RepID=A0ABU1AHP0_9BACT|nr:acetylxylan esterase [Coraliomargarita sp. SDUM461004]MDQ8194249.1 acetylxylan esterase [Coraliomargarita sp. SDUM461004]